MKHLLMTDACIFMTCLVLINRKKSNVSTKIRAMRGIIHWWKHRR